MFLRPTSRFNREKARHTLLKNDLFTEPQAGAILDALEAARRQALKRLLLWSRHRARRNAVPIDFYSERETKARLREKLTLVGFTGRQAKGIVWAAWHASGMGIYEPGKLFSEERRVLFTDRQVTDESLLSALSGDFERASAEAIRLRIWLDDAKENMNRKGSASAGGRQDHEDGRFERPIWHVMGACLTAGLLLVLTIYLISRILGG